MCDLEQIFHSFHVAPEHQNFLRFLWFKDNNPSKEIIENKMIVHVFRNGPVSMGDIVLVKDADAQ